MLKAKCSRMVMAVATFVCVTSAARHANAIANNVPFSYQGRTLTAAYNTVGSAAIFNNALYIAYISAADGNLAIVQDTNLGDTKNIATEAYEINVPYGGSSWGTALISYNGTLYLFYNNGVYDNANQTTYSWLAMITSTDGMNWSQQYILAYPSQANIYYFNTAPAAVVWGGQILVYINEAGGNLDQFNITGTSASGPYNQGGNYSTYSRPSATVWQGNLYLAFSDATQRNEIGMINYSSSNGWTSEILTGLVGIPSIYQLGAGALNMVYRGSNSHIYYTWTSNGVSFAGPYEDTASTTNTAPDQFTEYSYGQNWVFYVGENSALYINVES